jgi:protein SCO1/2
VPKPGSSLVSTVGLLTAALITLGVSSGPSEAQRSSATSFAAAIPGIGAHFTLTTPEGTAVTEHSFPGKWLLVYFGYTFCPDACPTALNALGTTLDELGPLASEVQPIFITVDPERDTPQVIATYVKAFDPRIVGLSGTSEQVAAAAKEFRVYYKVRPLARDEYAIDHSSFIYLINPRGQVVDLLTGNPQGHSMAEELRRLVKPNSRW